MPFTRDVPVKHEDVSKFLETYTNQYKRALGAIKDKLGADRRNLPALSCIYSIYSRADRQGPDRELKNARKIRLKVNEHAASKGDKKADLLKLPDVVGVTVTVLFPSDVQVVAAHIDSLIDSGSWKAAYGQTDVLASGPFEIATRYGQPHGGRNSTNPKDEGYFACHFYVVPDGETVIVEIQVKTVLHDAWGLKTHDLTYKNSVQIGENVMGHFGSLGQTLGRLDQQSDYLRQQIVSENAATDRKKGDLQVAAIQYDIAVNSKAMPELSALLKKVEDLFNGDDVSRDSWQPILKECLALFDAHPNGACQALVALGSFTDSSEVKLEALERLDMWAAQTTDFREVAEAKLFLHLAHFAFDDLPQAIDASEDLLGYMRANAASDPEPERVDARIASLLNSLAYYHAAIIGTDEGRKRSSKEACATYMNECLSILVRLKLINSQDDIWKYKAGSPAVSGAAYAKLDTCLFVRIAIATEAKQVREALAALVDLSKGSFGDVAVKALDLHQHFAYRRLLELEALEAVKKR